MIDKAILKPSAAKKPFTSNPFITDEANKISKALITKVNKPRVRILIGRVKIIKIGLIITLIMPKNTASHSAAQGPLILTPGNK